MADYKVNFKELKSRVGVDDVAYALGYRLDRKAGVGRYIELVLGSGSEKRDTLIISNPHNKAAQTFFRRDGSKGDVVTLIRENLDSFFVSGTDEWQKIAKVMARFANMPEPEYRENREFVKAAKVTLHFDASRYEGKPIDMEKILNVNVNVSGRVNPESGYSFSQFNFEERPLADVLSERLGYPVTIDNDTRAMTYGEYMQGCVKGEKDIIFVNVSWGLGIGIIIDGKIYKGKSGFSGEFGHVNTFDNEIICHCGKKGCLETEASGSALHRTLLERILKGENSILSNRVNMETPITLDEIIAAVNKEDLLCIEIVEEIGQKLGKQIAGLINIFNPELVIIGGTLSLTEDYITQPIRTAVRKYSLNLVNKDSVITTSKLKDKAGIVGACMLARSRMFEGTN